MGARDKPAEAAADALATGPGAWATTEAITLGTGSLPFEREGEREGRADEGTDTEWRLTAEIERLAPPPEGTGVRAPAPPATSEGVGPVRILLSAEGFRIGSLILGLRLRLRFAPRLRGAAFASKETSARRAMSFIALWWGRVVGWRVVDGGWVGERERPASDPLCCMEGRVVSWRTVKHHVVNIYLPIHI
jgi:hypothetical protein